MSSGSLTVHPGENPIRSEYLCVVGVVVPDGVEGINGDGIMGEELYDGEGSGIPGTDGSELDGFREDGGENVDNVGSSAEMIGLTMDVVPEVLSHTSKLTCVR